MVLKGIPNRQSGIGIKNAVTQVSEHQSYRSPIQGIVANTPLAEDTPERAISLVNFIARPYGVELRAGYRIHFDELEDTVGRIIPFYPEEGASGSKLFAATLEGIYDISTRTDNASKPSKDVTFGTQTAGDSDNCIYVQFAASNVVYLCVVSYTNGYYTYDSSSGWVNHPTGSSAGQINGVDPTNFDFITEWKKRLFFFKRGETTAWFLPVNQIAGTVSSIEFGPGLKHGGSLAAIASWSRDGGDGPDDLMVVVGTEGDVLVYQGTDPSTASAFALVGHWYIGKIPKGRRFFTKVGSDLYVLSTFGLISMEALLSGGTLDRASMASDNINPDLRTFVVQTLTDTWWEVEYFSEENIALLKFPKTTGSPYRAYCVELDSGGWSLIQDLPMYTIGSYLGTYFGSDESGNVYQIFNGSFDNVAFDDAPADVIQGTVITGFTSFNNVTVQKIFLSVSPFFLASAIPAILCDINTEFSTDSVFGSSSLPLSEGAIWDTDLWNVGVWAGGANTYEFHVGVDGVGHFGSLSMKVSGPAGTIFTHWGLLAQKGGSSLG